MMTVKSKGVLALLAARTLSGLNVNAMSYLLPIWIAPLGCVTLRLVFGAVVFWLISIFSKPEKVYLKDILELIALGGVGIFGYMSLYSLSISFTTPVNFAIFNAMQPLWVIVVSAIIYHESISGHKLFGLAMGFAGAMLCILSEPMSGTASRPQLGNMLAIFSSIIYSIYLVLSSKLVKRLSSVTILKYTFTSAAIVALLVSVFMGFEAPVFENGLHIKPILVLLFILIFPTVITYFLIPVGMKYLDSAVVALFGYVTLIVATGVSLILGMDKFDPIMLVSLLLIGGSIFWVGAADRNNHIHREY